MTDRDRRAMRLGILLVATCWIVFKGLPWGVDAWRTLTERVQARRVLLAETQLTLAGLSRLEDSARALTSRIAVMSPRLLAGSNAEVALSDLTGRLRDLAGRHHARVVSVTAEPDSLSARRLRRLRTSVVIETDFRGVTELLSALARDSLVTVVHGLAIAGQQPWMGPDQPESLQLEMRLTAWYFHHEVGEL